jgi:hypothetical protein
LFGHLFKKVKSFVAVGRKSDIVLAVVLFLLIDLGFRVAFSVSERPLQLTFDVPFRSRTWWAMKDITSLKKAPDVLLLGASDMHYAFYGGEATYLNEPQNSVTVHQSKFLEDKFKELASPYKTAFNMGIPGEMPSDAYFLLHTLVSNGIKPKAVYLSIVPRSFFDDTFTSPSASEIYRTISKLGGVGMELEMSSRQAIWNKLNYLLGRVSAVYGHREELVSWQHHLIGALCKLDAATFDKIESPPAVRKVAMLELTEDFAPHNDVMEQPYDPTNKNFLQNMDEYRARYRQFSMKKWDQQFTFFVKICQLCQDEGITFVAGNTPVTSENMGLVPAKIYDFYMREVTAVTRKYGASFVDLNTDDFGHEDFFDTVHLNGRGGQKFIAGVAAALTNTSKVAQSRTVQTK